MPHRQVFEGEYVQKAFKDRNDFDRQVHVRKQMNESTRRAAIESGSQLFDLEADLGNRLDLFYDMFHLNACGGEAVARAFIKLGLAEKLKSRATQSAQHKSLVGSANVSAVLSQSGAAELFEIHLINLDRSIDRLAKFKERNAHLSNVLRVSAVDGLTADRKELQRAGVITPDLPYTPGALGCALSHIALWKKAVTENRIVTIFEDDVVCSVNFVEEASRILSLVPGNWDLIQWGCTFDPLFVWLNFDPWKGRLQFYDSQVGHDYQAFRDGGYSSTPIKLQHSFGTQAYSVSPIGAHKLLNSCLPLRKRSILFPGTPSVNEDTGIDVAMCAAYPEMKAYLCLPPLVIHDTTLESDRTQASDRLGKGMDGARETTTVLASPESSDHHSSNDLVSQIFLKLELLTELS